MRSDYCPVANEPCQLVCLDGCQLRKAAPLQREWQGLTDEDKKVLVEQARKVPANVPCPDYNERLLTLTNDMLKEKNT